MDLMQNLKEVRLTMNKALEKALKIKNTPEKIIFESMQYTTITNGKALRPFFVFAIGKMLGISQKQLLPVALAIEMVHSYSLIHDDLPCMDNDTMRRGKPCCHIQYGEALAVLTGDALIPKAFEILADTQEIENSIKIELITLLAGAIGASGMVGGQVLDLKGEETAFNFKEILYLQTLKTGALFEFACIAPGIIIHSPYQDLLKKFAKAFGVLFQITDDILDEMGNPEKMGKTLGKDKTQHKSTFVSLLGMEKAKELAKEKAIEAQKILQKLPHNAYQKLLSELIDFTLTRKK